MSDFPTISEHTPQEFIAGEVGAVTPEKAGMPQMDHTTFPSQLFWLTVTFTVLYIALARFIMPRIHEVLETRQGRVSHDLDQAARLQKEAEDAKSVYQKALTDARNQAQELMTETVNSIKETSSQKHTQLDGVMAEKLAEAMTEVNKAKADAQTSLRPATVDVAAQIVETLTGSRPSDKEVEAVLGELNRERQAA